VASAVEDAVGVPVGEMPITAAALRELLARPATS
jgi:CO/xanthine dehydrogenase Mo-binding subunit